jgi:AcrR family transcriptional regulator
MPADTREDRIGTREKILEACRTLFNERGPAEVTTAEIAAAVGISEGNLHYHFRRKRQILVVLFDQFEAALEQVAERPARGEADLSYRQYLSGWFNLMWEWRCFYGASVYRLAPALTPRLAMVEEGRLAGSPEEIDRLVVNAWIVATYWIDYLRTRQGVEVITRDHLRWGFAQVQALFTPLAAQPASLVAANA